MRKEELKEVITMDKHLFWPVSAILFGVVVLMINLGYLPREATRYWPILLVLWGLMKIAEHEPKKEK